MATRCRPGGNGCRSCASWGVGIAAKGVGLMAVKRRPHGKGCRPYGKCVFFVGLVAKCVTGVGLMAIGVGLMANGG